MHIVAMDTPLDRAFPLDLVVRKPVELRRRLRQGDVFLSSIMDRGKVLYERQRQGMGRQGRICHPLATAAPLGYRNKTGLKGCPVCPVRVQFLSGLLSQGVERERIGRLRSAGSVDYGRSVGGLSEGADLLCIPWFAGSSLFSHIREPGRGMLPGQRPLQPGALYAL